LEKTPLVFVDAMLRVLPHRHLQDANLD